MLRNPIGNNQPQQTVFHGGAVILGDNSTAEVLAQHLRKNKVETVVVPSSLDTNAILNWLQQQSSVLPRPHLFLVTGPSGELCASENHDWYDRWATRPYTVVRDWYSLLDMSQWKGKASLIGVLHTGGQFGFADSQGIQQAEQGGLAGLIKSVTVESMAHTIPGIVGRLIDFDSTTSDAECVKHLLQELAIAQSEIISDRLLRGLQN